MGDPQTSKLSQIPAMDRVLNSGIARNLVATFGYDEVKRAAQETLESTRTAIRRGEIADVTEAAICSQIERSLDREANQQLRRVINLTGTILHTNLGRATLPEASIAAVVEVMRGASNLEYDLEPGRRGDRDSYLESQLCRLTGAEAATVVNNNAAAVMLVLNTLALGKQVPVSRGELVEIGGSFRIPDIMARSGCQLVEVGTTNCTHLHDFAHAIGEETAIIMKVHQSNYVIRGYTAVVDDSDLVKLCQQANIPFVVDLGSGALVDLQQFGLPQEPTPMQALKSGADIVTFSGDKLLGGPQAGIIVGRRDLVQQMKANPMKRALRCDKMTIAALSSLLRIYNHPERLPEQLPVLRMMMRNTDEIRTMVKPLLDALANRLTGQATVSLIDCESEIGSGALPDRTIASIGIAIRPLPLSIDHDQQLSNIARAFRNLPIPVIGRIHKGEYRLDCRCLENPEEFSTLLAELKLVE